MVSYISKPLFCSRERKTLTPIYSSSTHQSRNYIIIHIDQLLVEVNLWRKKKTLIHSIKTANKTASTEAEEMIGTSQRWRMVK
jgi:hypothetical protein